MNNEIIVNIATEGEKTYIVFNFEQPIKLEITTDSKETLKNIFYKILNHIINDNFITFKFTRTGEDLYNDVTEKYIQDLNNELEALKNNFTNPIEESNKAWNNLKICYNLFSWFNQTTLRV